MEIWMLKKVVLVSFWTIVAYIPKWKSNNVEVSQLSDLDYC
jgi:hypothetical protein